MTGSTSLVAIRHMHVQGQSLKVGKYLFHGREAWFDAAVSHTTSGLQLCHAPRSHLGSQAATGRSNQSAGDSIPQRVEPTVQPVSATHRLPVADGELAAQGAHPPISHAPPPPRSFAQPAQQPCALPPRACNHGGTLLDVRPTAQLVNGQLAACCCMALPGSSAGCRRGGW